MENATRALTMAASVLIALVIIGAVLLVFNNLSSYQNLNDQTRKDSQVVEFNNQFETYNRTDVRGSDICSLINRVLDYNERQSSAGITGSDIGYKPITLTIDLRGYINNFTSPDNTRYLITETSYTITGKVDEFESVMEQAKDIEDEYGQSNLTSLVTAITSIFIDDSASDNEKDVAIKKFNQISKQKTVRNWSELKINSEIRKDIYKYYEYIQFKRSYFDCISSNGKDSGVTYDENTGRITSMYFVCNGNIE